MTPDAERRIDCDVEVDPVRTLRRCAAGSGDPTWRFAPGRVERATSTPDGPAAVRIEVVAGTGPGTSVCAQGWGPGAQWLVDRVPQMLGLHHDDELASGLHPLVERQHRRHPGVRTGAALVVADVVVAVILGQRVTAREARTSWRQLVERHGSPAPGPLGLGLAPTPAVLARLGVADWHVLGVERQRSDACRRALAVIDALERAARSGAPELCRVVCSVPGLGPWTATGLAGAVLGDPDVVLLGDLHLPHSVGYALCGEPRGSDERMLELLEPWRGQRGRAVALIGTAGIRAPRRAPRYTPLPIARW